MGPLLTAFEYMGQTTDASLTLNSSSAHITIITHIMCYIDLVLYNS